MVAESTGAPETAQEEETRKRMEGSAWPTHRRHARGGLRRLITSSLRLAEVQYKIVLLKAKMTVMRMVIYAVLIAAAAVLGVLGVIFLYIGVFRLLTDLAGLPVWATFLIYAGVHVVTAVALMFGGARAIAGKDDEDDDEEKEKHQPKAGDAEGSK